MDTKSLSTSRKPAMARRQSSDYTDQLIEPFAQLRTEVDRLFEGFPFRHPFMRLEHFAAGPALEMAETDTAYKITAELPGIDPENIEVTYEHGLLRIAGEKKEERKERERGYRLSERSYGAFERVVELPTAANSETIAAKLKNGILTVTVDKDGEAKRNVRRISIDRKG